MDVGGLLERFAPPPGDAAQVRAAAEQWRRAADQLQGAADAASSRAASLVGSWSGPAKTAFDATWQRMAAHADEGSTQLRAAAEALDRAAQAIDDARARYWQLMAGAGVGVAIGVLLTPVTMGASDAVAGGAATAGVAALLGTLAEALGLEAAVLAAVAAAASRVLAAFTVQTGAMVATDIVSGTVLFPDHDPFGHVDLVGDAQFGLVGAVAVPIAGALGGGTRALAPRIAATGATGAVAQVVLDAAAFGLADTAAQVTLHRAVDPGEVAFAVLGAGAGSAAGHAVLVARARGSVASPPVPPAAPALAPHLRRVLEESAVVPAGRSFFLARRDPWLAAMAPLVPPQEGVAVVFAHGTTTTVLASGRVLAPRELADVIRADPGLSGRPIRLFACRTGRLDDGFAHQLAQELGVEVTAPTELAWLGPDGGMSTTSGRLVRDNWVQTVPHDGRWRTFAPRAP